MIYQYRPYLVNDILKELHNTLTIISQLSTMFCVEKHHFITGNMQFVKEDTPKNVQCRVSKLCL
jgi:hypothetical protein